MAYSFSLITNIENIFSDSKFTWINSRTTVEENRKTLSDVDLRVSLLFEYYLYQRKINKDSLSDDFHD